MGHGGVPFDIVWKHPVVDRPKIVGICDVSGSVAAAAQFLLLFRYSLKEVVARMDAFAFSNRLVPVGDILEDKSAEVAIAGVLKTIGMRSTDYGQALQDFCDLHLNKLDSHTTVIILGDARTNYVDPRLDLMRQINERARAVIWLNPEPESFWSRGNSEMEKYLRFCHVAKTCNTLAAWSGSSRTCCGPICRGRAARQLHYVILSRARLGACRRTQRWLKCVLRRVASRRLRMT